MSSDYIPIDSSDSHKKDEGVVHTWLQLSLKIFAFISIILFATFLATIVIQRQFISHEAAVTQENPIAIKSLPVNSTLSTFRPPIGGRLSCSRRVMVPSTTSPTDANQVRPADVQYIAAMGDSYTTGYLSFTSETDTTVDELRNAVGNSFVMGGNDEMESHVTLANILRHLNPSLRGYSTGIGLTEEVTNLNVAVPGMWVDDMQRQARELIRRFHKYSVQSIQNDWKLIQIFAGTRDVSGFCMGQGGTNKQEYKRNMTEAIEILQNALPKTIISILGTGNFDFLWNAVKNSDRSSEANIGFKMTGPCQIADAEILSQRRIEEYREANTEIVFEMQNRSRRDHVVIAQHIFDDLWLPLRNAEGTFNADFFAADVFHFSNYGNSLIAKQLWNQIVSPDSKKITNNARMADEKEALLCPELRCPFIRTPSNSVKCVMTEENIIDGVL